MAGGVGGDGVAAFEDAEGAALVKLEPKAVEAFAFFAEGAFGTGGEFELEFFEAQANCGDFHSEIEGDDAFVRDVETFCAQRQICAQRMSEARGQFISALSLLAQ